jgi:uncharacterized membrane protein
MRSRADIVGHPIHPMLIPFPVAFAVGTLAADIVASGTGSPAWAFTGYLLTIGTFGMGLIAAIPGLIDAIYVIPKGTTAKKMAYTHMTLNVTIVALYIASWIVKNANPYMPVPGNLILEIIAMPILLVSGWLGWTLVYRYGVGIDLVPGVTREHPVDRGPRRVA